MEPKLHRDKNRPSYFGNVKTRLGSKLHAGVTQPPGSISGPWETQPQVRPSLEARSQGRSHHPGASRPLGHIPHIRNARLRQYYLQGAVPAETTWELGGSMVKPSEEREQPTDKDSVAIPGDTVFSITSQFSSLAALDMTKLNRPLSSSLLSSSSSSSSSSTLISRQHLRVPKGKAASNQVSSPAATNPDPNLGVEPELESDPGSAPSPLTAPPSPSPDAEYDKLLDVEAVPMPDGQLCLLALPPECSQGEGPEAMPYLKLFCRSITDRKGVVSGILLVTSNKIFFDPCQSHPLVREHGCEEYLLSCSVDSLASVTFFSDISHVHFNSSTHRWKGKKTKSQSAKRPQGGTRGHSPPPHHQGETVPAPVRDLALRGRVGREEEEEEGAERESRDMAEAERQLQGSPLDELAAQPAGALGVAVLSSATFCCGGQDAEGTRAHTELLHPDGTEEEPSVKNQSTGLCGPSPGRSGGLMFVRLRVQRSTGNRKGVLGLQLGTSKTSSRRDVWFTLSQESSDELHAYLRRRRPDLSILEGGGEQGGEEGEEEFVLVDDGEEEELTQMSGRAGEDWEMVSVEESMGKLAVIVDKDPEGLSEIVQQSRILEASHVRELSAELPPRTVCYAWRLAYSTFLHGSSLKSLYRRLGASDSPVLIVIKDALDQVFGSFLSHPLRPSETFYGTGETFLFMLHPRFKCFRWTGENSFFIKGDLDSFAIGGGSGHFGLWLDEMLYLGRSSPCYTFNNCCLSEADDFRVMELEAWTFC